LFGEYLYLGANIISYRPYQSTGPSLSMGDIGDWKSTD